MRYVILSILLLMSLPSLVQNAFAQAVVVDKGTLIRNIEMEGFVLGDKNQFVKLFRPYRNKYLTAGQMDDILQKIQGIYQEDGYQQLVAISYKVDKHRLVFTALMTS